MSAFKEQIINEINALPFTENLVDVPEETFREIARQLIEEKNYQGKKEEYNKTNKKGEIVADAVKKLKKDIYLEIAEKDSSAIDYFLKNLSKSVKVKYDFYRRMSVSLQSNFLLKESREQIFPKPVIDIWQVPCGLEKYTNKEFLQEVNNIFSSLPATEKSYWVEIFKIKNKDIVAIVKRNGESFSGETSIILVNVNPDYEIIINYEDIHDLAVSMQKRCGSKEWDACYFSIMGNVQEKRNSANLCRVGKLRYDERVNKSFSIRGAAFSGKVEDVAFASKRSKTLIPAYQTSTSSSSFSLAHSSTKEGGVIHQNRENKKFPK